jgi:peptidoglycan/LPS O-acetylase OafA/YrhL
MKSNLEVATRTGEAIPPSQKGRAVEVVPTTNKAARIPALDFTKGALVLIMVLYHWLNYFLGPQGDIYKYLRFLTPSFIFITGFLISNVYLSKYGIADPRLPKRLVQRGLKILGVFILLNVIRTLLLPGPLRAQTLSEQLTVRSLVNVCVTGSDLGGGQGKAVAFYVLVPIGYLLLLSAGLLLVSNRFRYVFHFACALFLLGIVVLYLNGFQSANLELLAIGLLGVILGYIPIEEINTHVRHPYSLTIAYICYAAAITVWNVIYPLQIVGVCLSLMIIYLLGGPNDEPGKLRRHVVLLGKYSLFGYIAQIVILQFLHRGHRPGDQNALTSGLFLLAAFALTILTVEVTDRVRARLTTVDRLYRAVFA